MPQKRKPEDFEDIADMVKQIPEPTRRVIRNLAVSALIGGFTAIVHQNITGPLSERIFKRSRIPRQ